MASQRTSRRLRIEPLEAREVPAILGADGEPVEPTGDDTVVITSEEPPVDDTPIILDDSGEIDVIFQTLDGVDDEEEEDETPIDLAATVTVNKRKPSLGDLVTLTYKVTNNGDQPATGVGVEALLPEGLTFVKATPSAGTYDMASGLWSVPPVYPPGPVTTPPTPVNPASTPTLTVRARVTATTTDALEAGVSIVAAGQEDPLPANNEASVTMTPVLAKLKLKQSVSATTAIVNGTVIITMTVRNAGPGTARNVVVEQDLPTGLNFLTVASASQGTYSNGKWKVGKVMANTTVTLRVVAQVRKTGELETIAGMTATGEDDTTSVYSSSVKTTGTKVNNMSNWTYVSPNYGATAGPRASSR